LTWRAVSDPLLAAALLILFTPMLFAAMLLIKLTSRGPALYSQRRVGRHGRTFTLYKLRSMRHDCERHTGPRWATTDDPRVTPLGQFLRRTHLDELPQLWNVLRGEMGLVGPRPERPEFVAQLEKAIPRYRDREQVRPGLTGLAQVQIPPDVDVAGVRRKLACDLYYIESRGLWLDTRIMASTALKVIGVPCACSCRWLGIPSVEVVHEAHEGLPTIPPRDGPAPVLADAGWSLGWGPPTDTECAPA